VKSKPYDYYEGLTLNDLFVQAGGLILVLLKRVEVARMIMSEDIDDPIPIKAELYDINYTG
jgi:hypothetical protein